MNFLPGWNPGFMGVAAAAAPPAQPASIAFNGTDEYLSRVLSTSGASTTIVTLSFWTKVPAFSGFDSLFGSFGEESAFFSFFDDFDNSINAATFGVGDWFAFPSGLTLPTDTWEHWVIRVDTTQGTTANRVRFYQNGTQRTDSQEDVSQNEATCFFISGNEIVIGEDLVEPNPFPGKLAFIDVLEGVSADPTAFAFSDGGTWTRKPYAGSYGTYGFSLDGTDGFNDVSGNGQHFTGVNMDASNLDTADLPPYTT